MPNVNVYNNDCVDSVLLQKLSIGDRLAFTELYRRYWKPLFIDALKVLRTESVAEDIVQDVFLAFWDKRGEAKQIASVYAYLKTSVRRGCIRYIQRHINRYNYTDELAKAFDFVLSEIDISEELYVKDIQNNIQRTVEKMPTKMREVFELSRKQFKSHKEIASILGISHETVKKHIQNALLLIKKNLKGLDSLSKAIILYYFLSK